MRFPDVFENLMWLVPIGAVYQQLVSRRRRRSAADVVRQLALIPHPEGGFFREVYRSGAEPMASRGKTDESGAMSLTPVGERNLMTSIYYLLTRENPRQWLALNRSDHVHYFHEGGDVLYRVLDPATGVLTSHVLGPASPQLVVRGGCLKCAELLEGDYALLGEAVAPGFDFRDFQFAQSPHPELARFVKPSVPWGGFDAFYEAAQPASSVQSAAS